jgi:hypothetical protein
MKEIVSFKALLHSIQKMEENDLDTGFDKIESHVDQLFLSLQPLLTAAIQCIPNRQMIPQDLQGRTQ